MERTFIEQQKERLLALRQEMSEKVEQVQENMAQGPAPSEATDQEEVAVINCGLWKSLLAERGTACRLGERCRRPLEEARRRS